MPCTNRTLGLLPASRPAFSGRYFLSKILHPLQPVSEGVLGHLSRYLWNLFGKYINMREGRSACLAYHSPCLSKWGRSEMTFSHDEGSTATWWTVGCRSADPAKNLEKSRETRPLGMPVILRNLQRKELCGKVLPCEIVCFFCEKKISTYLRSTTF